MLKQSGTVLEDFATHPRATNCRKCFQSATVIFFHNSKGFRIIHMFFAPWGRGFEGRVGLSSVKRHLKYGRTAYQYAGQGSEDCTLHFNDYFVDVGHEER